MGSHLTVSEIWKTEICSLNVQGLYSAAFFPHSSQDLELQPVLPCECIADPAALHPGMVHWVSRSYFQYHQEILTACILLHCTSSTHQEVQVTHVNQQQHFINFLKLFKEVFVHFLTLTKWPVTDSHQHCVTLNVSSSDSDSPTPKHAATHPSYRRAPHTWVAPSQRQ